MQCEAWKKVPVVEGQTLRLTCPVNHNHGDDVEWRNPHDFLMFFNSKKVLKDPRSHVTLTKSVFSISVSNVTFQDRGIYKCVQYTNHVRTKKYKVLVVGTPKLEKTEHEDKTLIKCSASAHEHPPKLSWLLEGGVEIETPPNYEWENVSQRYTSESLLRVKIHTKKATVRCLVLHPALRSLILEKSIDLENHTMDTSTPWEHSATTLGLTRTVITPTLVPHISRKTSTGNHSESETTNEQAPRVSTTSHNSTKVNETTESTEGAATNFSITPSNITHGVEDKDGMKHNYEKQETKSRVLVLLVTCLIVCLVVVLAFFLLRLKRAHVAWKKEIEESDQSVESSRSKSSNEEKQKQAQEQRVQGFWNTSFTKYKVEEISEIEPSTMTAIAEKSVPSNPHKSQPCIKETEL
ncbi:cytotoxic and regulatory T-cell molecule isoform X2 [Brachyhypopomus gauderio]